MRKWHLVTYDVRDDTRLRRVARLMEGYGERIQYSVFRCQLSGAEFERLRWELTRVVEADDEVLMIPLCEGCAANAGGLHQKHRWDLDRPSFTIV
jgi:CRISPR-associated protein Cas2